MATHLTSRCQGLTKSGKPCRAAATEGGLCFFHANPNKAAELGRIGGKKNHRIPVGIDPLPDLDSAAAVRDAVKRMVADVYSGQLSPKTASALAPLLHLQLRAIEKSNFEERLARIEKLLPQTKAEIGKTERKLEGSEGSDELGRRLSQAVKPYAFYDGKIADES